MAIKLSPVRALDMLYCAMVDVKAVIFFKDANVTECISVAATKIKNYIIERGLKL
jgi:hypothetical protein